MLPPTASTNSSLLPIKAAAKVPQEHKAVAAPAGVPTAAATAVSFLLLHVADTKGSCGKLVMRSYTRVIKSLSFVLRRRRN